MDPFDLPALLADRATLEGLDPAAPSRMTPLTAVPPCRTVAILPGSFNPPTAAHLMLAERALHEGYDCVVFAYARATMGKGVTGLIAEDRLQALRAACRDSYGIVLVSHGLYPDQAEAAARLFRGAEIAFLLGSDKVLQIFDDRWYDDRDEALDRLFATARLVVAPRSDQSEALRRCLDERRNESYVDRINVLRLHPAVSELSSTHVRGLLRSGADPAGLVPSSVAAYLSAVRAYAPPAHIGAEEVDAYDVRARVIDALWRARGRDVDGVDLRSLVGLALATTPDGRAMRAALRAGDDVAFAELIGERAGLGSDA